MIQLDPAITTGVFTLLGVGLMALQQHKTHVLNQDRIDKLETSKLKVSLVTAERLRWLQDLRARVAAYYADAEGLTELLLTPHSATTEIDRAKELTRVHRELKIASSNITLMLSPQDPQQSRLIDSIKSTRDHVASFMAQNASQPQLEAIERDREGALSALTVVGFEAWRQVQALE